MIRRIEALNYRKLRYVSQELRPFQVLVGPNASGKSTFLDVPALLRDLVRDGVQGALLFNFQTGRGRARNFDELLFRGTRNSIEVVIDADIPKHLQGKIFGPIQFRPPWTVARYEVRIGQSDGGAVIVEDERLSLYNANTYGSQFLLPSNENLNRPTLFVPEGTGHLAVRHLPAAVGVYTFESGPVGAGASYFVDRQSLALASFPVEHSQFPVSAWMRDLLRDGIRVVALDTAAMRRPVSALASRGYSPDGSNLPFVIENLLKTHPQQYEDWLAHVRVVLPDLERIDVLERSEDRARYLAIRYRGNPNPVPAWLVSEGTLRLLALTILAYLPDEDVVYLIEEPENGLHPLALESVFQSLSSAFGRQFLVATHSPMFMAMAEPKDLLCFSNGKDGAAGVISGDKHPQLQHWKRDVDLGTLYAMGLLNEAGPDLPDVGRAAAGHAGDAAG